METYLVEAFIEERMREGGSGTLKEFIEREKQIRALEESVKKAKEEREKHEEE